MKIERGAPDIFYSWFNFSPILTRSFDKRIRPKKLSFCPCVIFHSVSLAQASCSFFGIKPLYNHISATRATYQSTTMDSNKPSAALGTASKENRTADPTAGIPYYDETRRKLKQLLEQKKNLERVLALSEEAIFRKETEYLDETPQGNIITGFDGYAKGASVGGVGRGAGTGRKSTAVGGTDRPFSGSSHSWKINVVS